MYILFLDTSALVKRYIEEAGSNWVISLCHAGVDRRVNIAEITPVEITSAITRRSKGGSLATSNAQNALAEFEADLSNEYFVLDITSALLNEARRFARAHALRGYDAVQLSTAVNFHHRQLVSGLSEVTFVSSDDELPEAARIEGLLTENPNNYA